MGAVQAEAGRGGGGRGGDQGGVPAVRPGRGRLHHQGRDARCLDTDGLRQVVTDLDIIYAQTKNSVMFKELRGGGVQVHGGDGPRQGREECLHVMNAQYSYNCASSGRESELRRVRAAVAGQLTAVSTILQYPRIDI